MSEHHRNGRMPESPYTTPHVLDPTYTQYQRYGRMPESPYMTPHLLDPTYRRLPESLLGPPHVPGSIPGNMVSAAYGGRTQMPSEYASASHGVLPEINWSDRGHSRHDLNLVSHMTGLERMTGCADFEPKRHEICLTIPTHKVHAELLQMVRSRVINQAEFQILSNVSPDNTEVRNRLLVHMKNEGRIPPMLYHELLQFS